MTEEQKDEWIEEHGWEDFFMSQFERWRGMARYMLKEKRVLTQEEFDDMVDRGGLYNEDKKNVVRCFCGGHND